MVNEFRCVNRTRNHSLRFNSFFYPKTNRINWMVEIYFVTEELTRIIVSGQTLESLFQIL